MSNLQKCRHCKVVSAYVFTFSTGVWCCKCSLGKAVINLSAPDEQIERAYTAMASHIPLQEEALSVLESLLVERMLVQMRK